MAVSPPPLSELREEQRVPTLGRARLEAPDALIPQEGSVVIEELSACGLRLNSEVPLHRDEVLVLRVPGEAAPLHATVVWVQERSPAHFRSSKTWIAGCRLKGDSIARVRLPLAPDPHARRDVLPGRTALRIAGLLGLLALLVYLYVRFAQSIGGGSGALKPW